jgi:Raf kinase inhibitor-like YbhB/YbcL family protein
MELTSTEFRPAEPIPTRFTGEGDDVSPPLLWSDLPTGTVSLALLCEDPDAPKKENQEHPFVHWVLFNVPPEAGMLPEGIPQDLKVDNHVTCEQGINSMDHPGYNGPYPPEGHGPHRYFFRLFALSRRLELPAHARRDDLVRAMEGSVLGVAELVGTYERGASQVA